MENLPKHIQEKIEEKYPLPIAKIIPDDYYNEDFTNRYMEMEILQKTAQWGYQLATDGREELEKKLAYIKDTLDDCREYMDDKADVDVDNDYFVPNKEAKLLSRIDSTIEKLNKHYGRSN